MTSGNDVKKKIMKILYLAPYQHIYANWVWSTKNYKWAVDNVKVR